MSTHSLDALTACTNLDGCACLACRTGEARDVRYAAALVTPTYTVNLITGPGCAEEIAVYTEDDGDDYVSLAHAEARKVSRGKRRVEVWRDHGSGPSLERSYIDGDEDPDGT